MICNAPLAVIPHKIVSSGGKVFAVENHPHKAVRFEFVRKFRVWLKELVIVIYPSMGNDFLNSKENCTFPKIFRSYKQSVSSACDRR